MSSWKVTFFGKFNIKREAEQISGIEARKVQELFSYLVLFRNQQQLRDVISETLWDNQSPEKSRKKLRQTLWHLRSVLDEYKTPSDPELLINNVWIQISLPTDFWVDTAEFEKAFNAINEKRIQELSSLDFKKMQFAANIYKGDLLEGWCQNWCIIERERYQTMYLMLLDKLVQYCELYQKYDAGIAYGMEILRHDHAYERTHRQLMRLYFITGNRTQALHQYDHCVKALRDELDVEPSESTKQLYDQIRLDTFAPPLFVGEKMINKISVKPTPVLLDILNNLENISGELSRLELRIKEKIVSLDDE